MDTILNKDLLENAIRATDAYLGIEKEAKKQGYATPQQVHDFTFYLSLAHDLLHQLGVIDEHIGYMQGHVEVMANLAGHDDDTLADLPFVHVPKADFGEIEESADKALRDKAEKSGIDLGTLKKVYRRGVAAWRTGHRPGTTPQQWGLARVNSYIVKGKTYHTADKDLREAEEPDNDAYVRMTDSDKLKPKRNYGDHTPYRRAGKAMDIYKLPDHMHDDAAMDGLRKTRFRNHVVSYTNHTEHPSYRKADSLRRIYGRYLSHTKHINEETTQENDIDAEDFEKEIENLKWEDIIDLYDEDDFHQGDDKKEVIDEKLSTQARLKRRMTFQRYSKKRMAAKDIKLRRASDLATLKKRAKLAARRMLLKRFLRGRDKASLSSDEKNRIEMMIARMGNLQNTLANKLMPKIRDIESKRLASKRGSK